jgi:hypothetical protein
MKKQSVISYLSFIAAISFPITVDAQNAKINDNDPSIIYSTVGGEGSTWGSESDPRYYTQDAHLSNFGTNSPLEIYGADAVVNFVGTGIRWLGKVGPNFGIAAYSIDGGPMQFFDAYSPRTISQHRNAVISGLPYGSHSLKIEVTRSKNDAASDYFQSIDSFNIIGGSSLYLQDAQVAGFNSPELSFSGKWQCGGDPDGSDISGGHCWTFEPNASVSWRFNGSLVEIFGRPDAEDGVFYVMIDGAPAGRVNGSYGTVDDDALNGYGLFQAKLDNPGPHTIQVINFGTGATQIDMFAAFQ